MTALKTDEFLKMLHNGFSGHVPKTIMIMCSTSFENLGNGKLLYEDLFCKM